MHIYAKSFCNLDSFARFLDGATVRPEFLARDLGPSSVRTDGAKWYGTENFEAADHLFQYGDTKSARKMAPASLQKAAEVRAADLHPRRIRSVAGFTPNVTAVLQGRPKTMYKIIRQNVETKVITVCYDCASDWTVKDTDRAAAALKLVNAVLGIEKKGYRVNLYICACLESLNEAAGAFIKIKDSGAYMDRKKMAYPLVNTSFFRRHMFKFIETNDGLQDRGWAGHYGFAIPKSAAGLEKRLQIAKAAGVNVKNIVSYYDIKNLDEAGIAALLMKK